MSKQQFMLALAIGLVMASLTWAQTPVRQDGGADGIVSVEAEDFDDNTTNGTRVWEFNTDIDGYSGEGYMRAVPDGSGSGNPQVFFNVEFVKTGIHFVWVRGYRTSGTDDSCHVGLDGDETTSESIQAGNTNNTWQWSNGRRDGKGRAQVDVTSPGVHVLHVRMREDGWRFDKIVLTTNTDFTPVDLGPDASPRGSQLNASAASPSNEASDVPWYVDALNWTAGESAMTHNVYFGTSFDDVNDRSASALVGEGLSTTTQAIQATLETTYYWAVDEVNAAPDFTVHAGDVWSFKVEDVATLITNVTVTADGQFSPDTGPEKLVDGSGLVDGLHGTGADAMWQSASLPATLEFQFDSVQVLHEMRVWNHNQVIEAFIGFGAKDVTVEVSVNGTDFTVLEGVGPFLQAPGAGGYAANTTVAFHGIEAKAVRLTITASYGVTFPSTGLSEVQFSTIPVFAREPQPADGATDVAVDTLLDWRSGRQFVHHELHLGTDPDELTPVGSLADNSFNALELDLQLGQTHYWRIDEVNDATVPSDRIGPVWSFTTVDVIGIDDMERYDDAEFLEIWATWLDGFDDPANGSLVGNGVAGVPETGIVHGGSQSLPFAYGVGAAVSEATRTFDAPMDWTRHGVQGLVLYFHGSAANTGGALYVKINSTKVAYDGDPADLMRAGWNAWYIPLADVAGNLASVTSLTLGVDGASEGIVYLDDITLTPDAREQITPVDPGTAGLLALYEFEGNVMDSSGNGIHGTLDRGDYVSSGTLNKGMSLQVFDRGFVDLGNPPSLNFGTGDWTVSAWFKTAMTGSGDANKGTLIGKGGDTGGGHRFALYMSESNEGKVTLTCDDDATKVQAHSTSTTNNDEWHIATGQREGRAIRIFIDGSPEAESTLPEGYDLSGTVQHNAYVGVITNHGTGELYKTYEGLIDDIHIYDRALSFGELVWLAGRTQTFDKP